MKYDRLGRLCGKRWMIKLGIYQYLDTWGNRWHVYFGPDTENYYHIVVEVNKKKNTITYWGKKKEIPYCDKCGRPFNGGS